MNVICDPAASVSFPFNDILRDKVQARVRAFACQPQPEDGFKRAAVTILLTTGEDESAAEAALIMTRRASKLRSHSGQWALPGGRMDAGESAIEAALREIHEEIGLRLTQDQVLGQLDDYPTKSGYLISPVVIWADDTAGMQANPDEVAAIFRVALRDFDRPDSPEFLTIPESPRPVIRLLFGENRVHAPTAAVIYQFIEVALRDNAIRVDHLGEPVWAWK